MDCPCKKCDCDSLENCQKGCSKPTDCKCIDEACHYGEDIDN